MSIKVNDYMLQQHLINIDDTKNIILLPHSYSQSESNKMLFDMHALNIVKQFKAKNLLAGLLNENPSQIAYQYNRSIDWISPTILITYNIMTNPDTFDTMLDIIKAYLNEIYENITDKLSVNCKFVYKEQKNGSFKEIEYTGHISGLSKVKQILQELNK